LEEGINTNWFSNLLKAFLLCHPPEAEEESQIRLRRIRSGSKKVVAYLINLKTS
jgi:hypothetical protein